MKNPFLSNPDESRTYHYVIQHHYRGKSVHCDLRIETDQGYLIGWTLMDQIPDEITEPVTTLEQARQFDQKDIWKIDWKAGSVKEREVKGGQIRPANIRAVQKKPEPVEWLTVEGVQEPGTVGATKEFHGVFSIIDTGTVEFGSQKAYFNEYFLDGKLKGRFCFRIIGRSLESTLPAGIPEEQPRTPYYWVFMQPQDSTPYVLSSGAADKDWLPPEGISALPETIRKNIPKRLRFWQQERKEALQSREELTKMEELNLSESNPRTTFILLHQWFRGQIVIRFGPSTEFWRLILGDFQLILQSNPLDGEVFGYQKPLEDQDLWHIGKKQELSPGSKLNPTKNTPSFIEKLDSGNCILIDSSDIFKKVDFEGKSLKGAFALVRESETSDIWLVQPSEIPGKESRLTEGGYMTEVSEETLTIGKDATASLKEALGILSEIKDKCSKQTQWAIDMLASEAGYGKPEFNTPPSPEDYPKPTQKSVQTRIKKALELISPFKEKFPKNKQTAIDILAGACGYGYPSPEKMSNLTFSELGAADEDAHTILVTIIKPTEADTPKGKFTYPEEVLKNSVPLWHGATAFCDHFNKSVRNIAGVYLDPFYEDGVKAKLRFLDNNLYRLACQIIQDKKQGLAVPDVGISADVEVAYKSQDHSFEVTQISRVISADIVFSPAAGGAFERVLNAAGLSTASKPENQPESGSTTILESENELVPLARLRDLQSQNDKLRAELQNQKHLQESLDYALARFREALTLAYPSIPEELISGRTVDEVDASLLKAKTVVEKIKSNLEDSRTRIPAGAPPRTGIDIESLSSLDKIKYGIAKK